MPILGKEKYSPEKIEKLAEYVRMYSEKAQPVEYEILVDGFKAVRRTEDPEMFYMFENFVSAGTKSVEVLFYIRNSNNNDKYIFTFKEDPSETLSGLEVENKIQENVGKAKKEWEYEQIKKENIEHKEYIEELEEEVEKLEKEVIEIKAKQSPLNGVLGDLGASFVESLVKRNPKLLNSIPGGHALAGMMDEGNGGKIQEEPEVEVSFKPKSASNEETTHALKFVGFIKKAFPEDKFDKVMQIIDRLAEDTEKVDTVLELLNGK
jgi:hypothetical protein